MLHDLVEESFPVVDGRIAIPERPGLGVTVKREFVEKYRHLGFAGGTVEA